MRTRRFYWDRLEGETDAPDRGDLVYGPVALYEVLDTRPVDSTRHADRFLLQLRRIGDRPTDVAGALASRPDARLFGRHIRNTPQVLATRKDVAWA